MTALRKRHRHKITPTIKSQVAAIMGTGIHGEIERLLRMAAVGNPKYILERSVMDVFEILGKRKLVTGRFDVLYDMKKMTDVKTAKVWKTVFDPDMEDWHKQQNLYAYLLHRRGVDVESINILCFYKDWKQGEALRDRNYPQAEIVEYPLNLWDWDTTESLLLESLTRLVSLEETDDDELPECTRDERWERLPSGVPVQYALFKNDQSKRAARVLNTMEEALNYARSNKGFSGNSFVECRYAARKRCETYCEINEYCNYYRDYMKLKEQGELNKIISLKEVL